VGCASWTPPGPYVHGGGKEFRIQDERRREVHAMTFNVEIVETTEELLSHPAA
jgi:hypothetical protein